MCVYAYNGAVAGTRRVGVAAASRTDMHGASAGPHSNGCSTRRARQGADKRCMCAPGKRGAWVYVCTYEGWDCSSVCECMCACVCTTTATSGAACSSARAFDATRVTWDGVHRLAGTTAGNDARAPAARYLSPHTLTLPTRTAHAHSVIDHTPHACVPARGGLRVDHVPCMHTRCAHARSATPIIFTPSKHARHAQLTHSYHPPTALHTDTLQARIRGGSVLALHPCTHVNWCPSLHCCTGQRRDENK